MEALDHVPLEAAAMSVLSFISLGDPVSSHLWVSCGYGTAVMPRVGACRYAHNRSWGLRKPWGLTHTLTPSVACDSAGCTGLGQAEPI